MPELVRASSMNPLFSRYSRSMKIKPGHAPEKKPLGRSSSHADEQMQLINAVAHEDVKGVAKILKTADVNVCALRHPGFSALHHVCINGNVEILNLLLKCTLTDVNVLSKSGVTPLKLAVMHGHFDVAQRLLELGAREEDIRDGV